MRLKHFILSALFISAATVSYGFDQNHTLFTQVMKKFNNKGLVDYKGLKANPKILNDYLKTLNSVSTDEIKKWSEADQIAFWSNAYNAFTLKAIIDNYPIKSSFLKSRIYPKNSIRQIDGVWDKLKFPVAGRQMTLNNIEHDTMRKDFNEPRIHMDLVCAAIGCPLLREEAYVGKRLNAQLEDQTKQFLSDPEKFRIDTKEGEVYLSSILDWFSEDFVKKFGTKTKFTDKNEKERAVLNFVSQYLKPGDKQYLDTGKYDIEYLKYDWTLNEWKK